MPALVRDKRDKIDLAATGRACCGGRLLCENGNMREKKSFVVNKFKDWYCSVDKFFLYVKQVTGEVFVNKDCKMTYQGQVGPVGHLNDTQQMLNKVGFTPTIQCAKVTCQCGLCAPKAVNIAEFDNIMEKFKI